MIRTIAGQPLETRDATRADRGFIAPRMHQARALTDTVLDAGHTVVWCVQAQPSTLFAFVVLLRGTVYSTYVLPALRKYGLVEDIIKELGERAA